MNNAFSVTLLWWRQFPFVDNLHLQNHSVWKMHCGGMKHISTFLQDNAKRYNKEQKVLCQILWLKYCTASATIEFSGPTKHILPSNLVYATDWTHSVNCTGETSSNCCLKLDNLRLIDSLVWTCFKTHFAKEQSPWMLYFYIVIISLYKNLDVHVHMLMYMWICAIYSVQH